MAAVERFLVAIAVLAYIALPMVLITGWRRWLRRVPQQGLSGVLALAGFTLGSGSAVLAVGSIAYAMATGGFRYYAPAIIAIYRIGILLSLAGLAFAIGGVWKPNALRWQAPVLSFGMLLLWFIWASGE